jgi:hypothetical protein
VKVESPVGEYEYRVRKVTLEGGRVRIAGSLGVWETTMEIEPADWLALGRRAVRPLALLVLAGVCARGLAGTRSKGC